jgi:hypothetical protein
VGKILSACAVTANAKTVKTKPMARFIFFSRVGPTVGLSDGKSDRVP